MKLSDAQKEALLELKQLRIGTAKDGLRHRELPSEGLWWMPRGYRSISHGTIKALHAKGLIEMHSDSYNRYDWCRINDKGLELVAPRPPCRDRT